MIVCICNQVTSTMLKLAVAEAPVIPYDPFSRDYVSTEDQIYNYLVEHYKLGTNCGNCEIFTRQVIRDTTDY